MALATEKVVLQQIVKEARAVFEVDAISPTRTIGEPSREQRPQTQVELHPVIAAKEATRSSPEQRGEVVFAVHTISVKVKRIVRIVKVAASITEQDVRATTLVDELLQSSLTKVAEEGVLVEDSSDNVAVIVYPVSSMHDSRPGSFRMDLVSQVSTPTN